MKKLNDTNDNFWISYSDLMAGLLFVFILVVGAVVIKYRYIATELTKTKEHIQKLTGVKSQVIMKLKQKLGNKIKIDPKTGSISIPGDILFGQGEYQLKDSAKEELRVVLGEYLEVLLTDQEIKKNIDRIIIEGHTNTDGDYLYNLELSQKRALEVMNFIFQLKPNIQNDLREYVTASGRSYSDVIIVNGQEDKYASRRIEIQFRLKNDGAISEISRLLGSS
jgi:chemotaxis protein MotB